MEKIYNNSHLNILSELDVEYKGNGYNYISPYIEGKLKDSE